MFSLSFDTRNAAFDDGNRPAEAARILRDIAEKVAAGQVVGRIRDANGNKVGEWKLTPPA